MIFNKIRTVEKLLSRLRAKLAWLLKLVDKCGRSVRRYVVNILDIEARIKHLERVERSFGLSVRKVDEFGKTAYQVSSSNGVDAYIVRPRELDPLDRCECGDVVYRGLKCKHQIAVERKFGASFQQIVSVKCGLPT